MPTGISIPLPSGLTIVPVAEPSAPLASVRISRMALPPASMAPFQTPSSSFEMRAFLHFHIREREAFDACRWLGEGRRELTLRVARHIDCDDERRIGQLHRAF